MFTLGRDLTQPPPFTDDATPGSEDQGSAQGHHAVGGRRSSLVWQGWE